MRLASYVKSGLFDNIEVVNGSTHYHAVYVSPYWTKMKKKVKVIADHVFYVWEK